MREYGLNVVGIIVRLCFRHLILKDKFTKIFKTYHGAGICYNIFYWQQYLL